MKNLITLLTLILTINVSYGQNESTLTAEDRLEILDSMQYASNRKVISTVDIDSLENELTMLINNLRVKNNLNTLKTNKSLKLYSSKWSDHILNTHNLSHSNIREGGVTAENVWAYFMWGKIWVKREYITSLANDIYNDWLTSPLHKKNMLLSNIKEIGVSISIDKRGYNKQVGATMVVN